ncbi:zinc finger FYVE domain-containing protein 1-like isoform X2 [Physella acuta]|uniref:zinc finger FYVE domain-containing protein 1-like isoform X2 n=1 Tax=Physella acuta TaxID=109671 RepID=UPI0027DC9CC6|nr:zinc finger FYVE domain-containing protein 1-like isoform X2 [Physella acuta]
MKPTIRRRPKSKSSIQTCQEKFCCTLINSKATYYCDDCKSAQCTECVNQIHKSKLKYDFHCRRPLPAAPESELCQAKNINLICQEKNFPDIWCENCKLQLCFSCYDLYHSCEKRKHHINVTIAYHQKKLQELQQKDSELQNSVELYQDAITDMIKPSAPYSLADEADSMTFCSFPQEFGDSKNNMAFTSSNSSFHSDKSSLSIPDICQLSTAYTPAATFANSAPSTNRDKDCDVFQKSFLLVDAKEEFQIKDHKEFIDKLGCHKKDTFKVISIFGNTGDGKSYTLNHVFFKGCNVFRTSPSQDSCTVGVWCALSTDYKAIVLDTEGLLGTSENANQRTRLLLKILAVSDIVVYRTKAERLHNDMYVFLSNASKAYCERFKEELINTSKRNGISEANLGPSLIVFQETNRTDTLEKTSENQSQDYASHELRKRFYESGNLVNAFHETLYYVGIRTEPHKDTDFTHISKCIIKRLQDNSVRTPRKAEIIFKSLKAINDKFSGMIETPSFNTFPDEYFTCTSKCLACKSRCKLSMNHDTESEPHDAGRDVLCEYQSQYGNKVFMCKTCLRNKKQVIVMPKTSSSSDNSWLGLTKYIWSGYVYECPNCGVIYRSREHWFGNEEEEKVLHVEYRHVWPQGPTTLDGTHNAARKVIDSFHYVADTISSVGARPTKYIAEWTADQINPSYWVPNSEIIKCSKPECQIMFDCAEQKHHCRSCGKGFCSDCSSKKRPVPERGWGPEPVRVCDACYSKDEKEINSEESPQQVALTARKVGEVVTSTFSAVASALDYPIGVIKSSAMPSYWVPDDKITACCVCEQQFGFRLAKHHCRACGQGVCESCSRNKRAVPLRGWDYPVRVCDKCESKTDRI